ncbi:glycosyltransferase family 20-domain-containing protein [Halteromyces radiatus]|uniref:glycosyltransferase family 20-domain-containing protein n=1 Tax=Halteromyces radiatus TaxID=101107 RepID=UPI0022208B47|nr:glycosyltransferase family 20-domain-containing protein [Halteromyces radiatus]KAI8096964.1 glycosyltransferase family 20-domain-containing protein [Halteromyces radiatus]
MVQRNSQVIDTEELRRILIAEGEEHVKISGKIISVVNHLPFQFSVPMTPEEKLAIRNRKEEIHKRHQHPVHFKRDANYLKHNYYQQEQQQQQQGEEEANEQQDKHELDAPISNLGRRASIAPNFGQSEIWNITPRPGHSAIYAGTDSLRKHYKTLMIGGTGQIKSELTDQEMPLDEIRPEHRDGLSQLLKLRHGMIPIFLKNEQAFGHYEGYCKQVLWPLFHYVIWNGSIDESQYWDDYVAVNQAFAQTIADNYEPGDIVWIQDYHLLLVPQILRDLKPLARIGLFIHTPFPSSEMFRCLPHRREILDGILGSNLVGFQTYNYARHFASNCTRIMGYECSPLGVETRVDTVGLGTFPIGIDVERTRQNCHRPNVAPKVKAIREKYLGKYIIVGRDKLDPMKGVLQKLEAFEKFLYDYPEWQDKVVLIQVTSPGVIKSPKMEAKVAETVNRINTQFGSIEFTPVNHYHQHIDRDEFYALLISADVALVTPICDGMNTTSFEYVVAQEERHGPLILSEFTGTARSMGAALIVNPWDYSWVSSAINECLIMSDEDKAEKAKQLTNFVHTHTAGYWATRFINTLVNSPKSVSTYKTSKMDPKRLLIEYRNTRKALFFFDYDGTLTPIVDTPLDAKPSHQLIEALKNLCQESNNTVWVVSGRDQNTLEEWLGHIPQLGLSAEHGCFTRLPGSTKWINNIDRVDMAWKDDVREIFQYYSERTPGSFVEEKRGSLTWHYRMTEPPSFGEFQAKECQNHLENAIVPKLPVEILLGKKNIEIRPTVVNKGSAVKRALAQTSAAGFILCAGDDRTDEDMFKTLKKQVTSGGSDKILFTLSVGPVDKKTLADWYVETSQDLVDMLSLLNKK